MSLRDLQSVQSPTRKRVKHEHRAVYYEYHTQCPPANTGLKLLAEEDLASEIDAELLRYFTSNPAQVPPKPSNTVVIDTSDAITPPPYSFCRWLQRDLHRNWSEFMHFVPTLMEDVAEVNQYEDEYQGLLFIEEPDHDPQSAIISLETLKRLDDTDVDRTRLLPFHSDHLKDRDVSSDLAPFPRSSFESMAVKPDFVFRNSSWGDVEAVDRAAFADDENRSGVEEYEPLCSKCREFGCRTHDAQIDVSPPHPTPQVMRHPHQREPCSVGCWRRMQSVGSEWTKAETQRLAECTAAMPAASSCQLRKWFPDRHCVEIQQRIIAGAEGEPANDWTEELAPPSRKRERNPCYRVGISPISGYGLFATRPIPAGDVFLDYAGEMMDETEAARRHFLYRKTGLNYIFDNNEGQLIDSAYLGLQSRFINGSSAKAANCEAHMQHEESGIVSIKIKASRKIAANEELLLYYGDAHFLPGMTMKRV